MKSLTSLDAATGLTLRSRTGASFLGRKRSAIPATTMSAMMTNQMVIIVPNFPLPAAAMPRGLRSMNPSLADIDGDRLFIKFSVIIGKW
jgi:hypothetical protein